MIIKYLVQTVDGSTERVITNVDHVTVHPKNVYYWLKNRPRDIFRINLDSVSFVRFINEKDC